MQTSVVPLTELSITPDHPLDQLTAQEVTRASSSCKKYAIAQGIKQLRFNTVMLQEPAKAELLMYEAGRIPAPARQAYCVLISIPDGQVIEAVVDLHSQSPHKDGMHSWKLLEGVQPLTTPDDNIECESIVRRDPRVQQLLLERYSVTNMELVICDSWTVHGTPPEHVGKRLMQSFLYLRTCPKDNEYAHPLDMVPLVDLNNGRVVHIDMYDVAPPVPAMRVNYHRDLQETPFREDIKELSVVQPQGPSFSVEGNLVRWQKWQFRVGFNSREGLVLHQLGYNDRGVTRPVLHRASLVEMAVPYGDPNYPYVRKCAFDVGDYGMGFCANSLQLGCDCLGHIKYFDAVMSDARGDPVVVRKAVCLHEEDAGIMWKHTDLRLAHAEVRRARRLVISMVSTFANYEYAMYWYLYQDGTISMEMKLTGILSTSVQYQGEGKPDNGVLVAPGVAATNHQHFFCFRLDPAVDDHEGGKNLVVTEVNAGPIPLGPQNPYGNAYSVSETVLESTHQAQRMCAPEKARHWKIKNPAHINPITQEPVSYKLLPGSNVVMLAQPGSLLHRRAQFAVKHLWVTPHDDAQRYPAGDHVVSSSECLGLAQWTKQDAPLAGADPVLWYSFGVTHIPRIEDFPVMPCEVVGFQMRPCGFFTINPSNDLPPDRNMRSKEECCERTGRPLAGSRL